MHKSQSLTLTRAVVDIDKSIFEPSMAYTALSRVGKLENIILSSFKQNKLMLTNVNVVKEYQRLDSLPTPGLNNNWATLLLSNQVKTPTSTTVSTSLQTEENNEDYDEYLLGDEVDDSHFQQNVLLGMALLAA